MTKAKCAERADFYLWHLRTLGVLDEHLRSELWDKACKETPVKVAIIDTGVDTGHPNLAGAFAEDQVDFTPHLYGAVYAPPLNRLRELQHRLSTAEPDRDPDVKQDVQRLIEEAKTELTEWSECLALEPSRLQAILSVSSAKGDDPIAAGHALVVAAAAEVDCDGFPPNGSKTSSPTEDRPLLDEEWTGFDLLDGLISAGPPDASKDMKEALRTLWNNVKGKRKVRFPLRDPSRFFGAHGTGCAGLIGGRPPASESAQPGPISYFGVNPFCQIIPVATPYSHEILPMIHALLYAVAAGADVIHIPRGLPDYAERERQMRDTHQQTRIDRPFPKDDPECTSLYDKEKTPETPPEAMTEMPRDLTLPEDQADLCRLRRHSELFEALLKMLSWHRYIVLSAGNDGWEDRLSYPARIHRPGEDGLIVVGARNRRSYEERNWADFISSYSNGRSNKPEFGLRHMLSDDAFALDRARWAYDECHRDSSDFTYAPHRPGSAENTFSPWAPLSLDVRGSYGYAAGRQYDPPDSDPGEDMGDLYALFGGTSGASALAAGLIALQIQVAGKAGNLTRRSADNSDPDGVLTSMWPDDG